MITLSDFEAVDFVEDESARLNALLAIKFTTGISLDVLDTATQSWPVSALCWFGDNVEISPS
jgi:hypothetical protein